VPTSIKKVWPRRTEDDASRRNRAIVLPAPCLGGRCGRPLLVGWVMRLAALALSHLLMYAPAHAEGLQVLHWWKSASERKAVDVLVSRLADEGISWRDGVIPSGSGVGASIVLRSRILAGDAPEVAQLNGVLISEWDSLGLLLDVDSTGINGKWDKLLFPTVLTLVQPHGHFVAAPLGIHRINTLFFNRKLFAQHGLAVPQTWAEFELVAAKLQRLGIVPLAQSSEPWQVVSLFETLVLAEGGATFYRDLFVKKNAAAFADERLARALQHLRYLKKWMTVPVPERPWTEVTRQFADGGAAMMVMGDWAKAELYAWGQLNEDSLGCTAVPGTANYHLYDIDTLAMLSASKSYRPAQEKLAKVVMSAAVQADYNQLKGSVPVLRNPDMTKMDSCARASWKLFASGAVAQVPSLAHRMATDEVTKDAIIAEVHRYFLDDKISTADTQRRLGIIARTVSNTFASPISRKR
jgi:glucose/mannose transport system substrate-binding protein